MVTRPRPDQSRRESPAVDTAVPTADVDRRVAQALQRLATTRAELLLAERLAEAGPASTSGTARELIESARAELLWATATAMTAAEQERARRRLTEARAQLAEVLERFGFASFAEFAASPAAAPANDTDPHVRVARMAFEDAAAEWESLQLEVLTLHAAIESGDGPQGGPHETAG